MRFRGLNQRGDTILEVLICVAVLSLVVAAAYTLTNKNQISGRQSQERAEALKIADAQMELLRTYAQKNLLTGLPARFCMINDTVAPVVDNGIRPVAITFSLPANASNDNAGNYPDNPNGCELDRYQFAIWGPAVSDDVGARTGGAGLGGIAKNIFAITVRWDSITGGPREQVIIYYSTHDSVSIIFNRRFGAVA